MSPENLDPLWEPLKIGGIEVPNRIFVSAHMMAFGDEPIVHDRYINYYEERARGGVGLLITGAEGTGPKGWHAPHFQAWREDASPRYQALANAVHQHGTKIFTQLWNPGLQDHGMMDLDNHHPTYGPSGVQSPFYGRIAKAMETEDIQEFINDFARCAELAQANGIDGVEVAGGHGYLINAFLSPFNNRREDEYGGSPENRARFAIEIGQEIRRRCGDDFPIMFRMIFEEFVGPAGANPQDSAELLKALHAAGVYDAFNISGGTYHSMWSTIMPASAPLDTPYVDDAALAKATIGAEVPVAVACKIYELETAAEVITSGKADLVAMTRAHLADPHLIKKAREGRRAEVRRCVGMNQGCVHRQFIGAGSSCTVNPVVGREGRWGSTKLGSAGTQRRVLVVGGGPGGMKFAEIAAGQGHDVTIWEKGDKLGGKLHHAAQMPGRQRWADLVTDLSAAVERAGVTVQFGTEATADNIREFGADMTVIATGGHFDHSTFSVLRPDRNAIPGADPAKILDPVQVLEHPELVGDNVVIIDDFNEPPSYGTALNLASQGKKVTRVTMNPGTLAAGYNVYDGYGGVYASLGQSGVVHHTETTVNEITDEGVSITQIWTHETQTVPADTVIVTMLRKPNDELYFELKNAGIPVRRIGDAVAPRRVDEAIYEGFELGLGLEAAIAESKPLAGVN
ncbi:unannotated protein [freshwater metagenome]|uniref:Unannotated protein n=1 Tax=freshwater metagenome TaxID=449393 RepID=A0A6J7IEM8_9ZZZZ|nr:NAD(P)-binding protein [Actinomycetota bacterium]